MEGALRGQGISSFVYHNEFCFERVTIFKPAKNVCGRPCLQVTGQFIARQFVADNSSQSITFF